MERVGSRRSSKKKKRVGTRIPHDLVIEILSLLPAKSLVRFRRVCKLWLSITSDPRFIDTHLDRSRKSRPPSVLFFLPQIDGDHHYGITVIDDDPKRTPDRLLILPRPPDHRRVGTFNMCRPCNGLVCISDSDGFIQLVNPTTGERHTPPPHYRRNTDSLIDFIPTACLGFHPETKEYKVVRFFLLSGPAWGESVWRCEIYTLGTNTWRQVHYTHHDSFPFGDAVNANGALYWLINNRGTIGDALLSFDLKEEKFARISVPDFKREYPFFNGAVVELQGSVCMVVCPDWPQREPQGDVWMMVLSSDGHGSTHKWVLKYSISCFTHTLLFIHNQRILVGNSNQNNWNQPTFRDEDDPCWTLEYHRLNRKDGCTREVYHEGKLAGQFIYHYFDGQDGSNYKEFHRSIRKQHFAPFAHVESLVSLRHL